MSEHPGYPTPYSPWNQLSSARAVFPLGSLPTPPGLISGLSGLQDPAGYFPPFRQSSLPDQLVFASPSFPPSASYGGLYPSFHTSRYRPSLGISDLPLLGIEPSYGCSLTEARGLLHSPNFALSQNPSPLTFDQVYRSVGNSSVSPVSQYRNHFDQRYVGSRLLLPGVHSETLICEQRDISNAKSSIKHKQLSSKEIESSAKGTHKKSKQDIEKKKESKDVTKESEAKDLKTEVKTVKKLWNPFESDTKKESELKAATADFSIKTLSKDSKNENLDTSDSIKNNNAKKQSDLSNKEAKTLPRQPIPKYPVKPIPVYDNKALRYNQHPNTTPLHLSPVLSPFGNLGQVPRLSPIGPSSLHVSPKKDNEVRVTIHHKEDNSKDAEQVVPRPEARKQAEIRDLNQNSEVQKNCNIFGDDNLTQLTNFEDTCVIKESFCELLSQSELPGEKWIESGGLAGNCEFRTDNIENCLTSNAHIDKGFFGSKAGVNINKKNKPNEGSEQQNQNDAQLNSQVSGSYQNKFINFISNAENNVPYSNTSNSVDNSSRNKSTFVQNKKELAINVDGNKCSENKDRTLKVLVSPSQYPDKDGSKLGSPTKSPRDTKSKISPSTKNVKSRRESVKDELSALSCQVNEVRNRRNSINSNNKENWTSKLLSPTGSIEGGKTSGSCINSSSNNTKVNNNSPKVHFDTSQMTMAAGGSAITMLKNSEDSLSASISSSHISESDSDTQLSGTDNAEKLFSESQSLNTPSLFSSHTPSQGQDYMTPMNDGHINCDSQFYKPHMCQNENVNDNQKPYLCVQQQNQFNEKPEILPPYENCYPNQTSHVLPPSNEGNFQSHDNESANYPTSNAGMNIKTNMDPSIEYDESSLMSEPSAPECDSQLSVSHGSDSMSSKSGMLESSSPCMNNQEYMGDPSYQWDFLHSKQYIDNIYSKQFECEAVKNEEQDMRYSDSPKTFIDLDTSTKKSKDGESVSKESSNGNSKHYGKPLSRHGYLSGQRSGGYGNEPYDYSGNMGNRWNNFNRNGTDSSNQSESGHYEHNQNQYRHYNQPGYPPMNQGQNGGDKSFNQSSYHRNYNQADGNNYNQNPNNYQGNYGNNQRYDNNYYSNKGSGEYNSQNNMYPPTSSDMPGGGRYGNQGYNGASAGGYGQHYNPQSSSHPGPNNMGPYPNNSSQNYNYQRNTASPASTGSEPPPVPVKKKRGRKRKADKEPQDENKPRPNTIVVACTNLGPLIDTDNPDTTIETYDYNNQIETIFNYTVDDDLSPIGAQFLQIEQRLSQKLLPIKYGHPVNVIYTPLTYAFQPHRDFIAKFCTTERPILFLGMNPGPYGMSQNGVPFGEATIVRDWLKITGDVYKPEIEHPKKNITGLACTRNEVSGARFWGLFTKVCVLPDNFFKNCFVQNFCPQAYMSESGKNITPPQLIHAELDQINEACDAALVELVKLLNTRIIIAVGKFVQQRASKALHNAGVMNIKTECILHPSPINPHANKGWEQIVAKQLIEMNVMQYLNTDAEFVQKQIEEWEKIAQSNAKLAE